ncbi:MAG: hypothetical protein VZR54_08865 [Ruminococcus sp.]|nr:hypothetical protein [Ruminococcus sp.]
MKKSIAIILSALMIIGYFSLISASAVSAKVTLVDNKYTEGKGYEKTETSYDANIGETVKYTCSIQCPELIEEGQCVLKYDNSVLEIKKVNVPNINNAIFNPDFSQPDYADTYLTDSVKLNFTNHSGLDFTTEKVLFEITFNVISEGEGKIELYSDPSVSPDPSSEVDETMIISNKNDEDVLKKTVINQKLEINVPESQPSTEESSTATESTSQSGTSSTETASETSTESATSTETSTETGSDTSGEPDTGDTQDTSETNPIASSTEPTDTTDTSGTGETESVTNPDDTSVTTDPAASTADPSDTSATDNPEATTSAQDTTDSSEATTSAQSTTDASEATTSAQATTDASKTTTSAQSATKAQEKAPVTPAKAPKISTLAGTPSVESASNFIAALKNDKDPKGSTFSGLKAKANKTSKTSVKVTWAKVKGTKGYIVFGNKCGSAGYKKLATVKTNKFTQKKLKKGTYYKYLVLAYNSSNKIISTSKTMHVATKGGKVGNAKSIKFTNVKKSITLNKGKKLSLATKTTPQSKKLKIKNHRKVKFESTNPAVVKVNGKGKIAAKKKGTAVVYAYAQNGVAAKVKVKVK